MASGQSQGPSYIVSWGSCNHNTACQQRYRHRQPRCSGSSSSRLMFASMSSSSSGPNFPLPWGWPLSPPKQQQQTDEKQQQASQERAQQAQREQQAQASEASAAPPAVACSLPQDSGTAGDSSCGDTSAAAFSRHDHAHHHEQQQLQSHSQPLAHQREHQHHQQQQEQQKQQQQQRPPWFLPFGGFAPPPASATTCRNAAEQQQNGLRSLSRHINSEAAKLAGFVGAQLLLHLSNLRRAGERPDDDVGDSQRGSSGAPWGRLRLPWQRGDGAGGAGSAAAGTRPAFQPSEAARKWVVQGVAAEKAFDLREALSCYQSAVALEPANLEYVCRLAKQWSDLTYEPGATAQQVAEVNAKGIEYAERGITLAPKAAAGYMASCVSKGRLALISDNKTKVRLAKEAQEAARTALQMEPDNDLAHHLMGRWHFEMAQINFVVRQLIRLVYGAALAPGTFADALSEYQTATSLNPTKLIHRVELGRTLLRLGRKQEALRELSLSVQLEVEDINAQLQKEDAELLLDKLRKEFDRSVQPLSWGAPFGTSGGSGSGGGGGEGGGGPGDGADAVVEVAGAVGSNKQDQQPPPSPQ